MSWHLPKHPSTSRVFPNAQLSCHSTDTLLRAPGRSSLGHISITDSCRAIRLEAQFSHVKRTICRAEPPVIDRPQRNSQPMQSAIAIDMQWGVPPFQSKKVSSNIAQTSGTVFMKDLSVAQVIQLWLGISHPSPNTRRRTNQPP